MGTQEKYPTCPNNPCIVQTTKWPIKRLHGANFMFSSHLFHHHLSNMSLSSSNSSHSHPGHLDAQFFHCMFPAALPRWKCNILYVAVLQQPSLVANLEQQSLYEEDISIQSLVHVLHHLCSTQIYLGSFEPCINHMVSSTLHIVSALDDTLDLLHDHRFHHHILALPPCNITLTHIF